MTDLWTMTITALTFLGVTSGEPRTFSCKEDPAKGSSTILLSLTRKEAKLAQNWDTRFTRPSAVLPVDTSHGTHEDLRNYGKSYQHYHAQEITLAVPKFMIENKSHQGAIIVSSGTTETRYSCERSQ